MLLMRLSQLFSDIPIITYGPVLVWPKALAHRFVVSCLEGLTHWSLTGSTVTDEDTLMGFSDGLSQSGIHYLVHLPAINAKAAQNSQLAAVPVIKSVEKLIKLLSVHQWCQLTWKWPLTVFWPTPYWGTWLLPCLWWNGSHSRGIP